MSELIELIPTTKGEFLLWGMLIALIYYYFEDELRSVKDKIQDLR